jgi:hypothetical protein
MSHHTELFKVYCIHAQTDVPTRILQIGLSFTRMNCHEDGSQWHGRSIPRIKFWSTQDQPVYGFSGEQIGELCCPIRDLTWGSVEATVYISDESWFKQHLLPSNSLRAGFYGSVVETVIRSGRPSSRQNGKTALIVEPTSFHLWHEAARDEVAWAQATRGIRRLAA